jgi:hypothetical protein
MYKKYASPNFKFWLLTKFMQLHTNLQLQGGEGGKHCQIQVGS